MDWVDNVLVLADGSLFTVVGSNLELRGKGWERRRKKGESIDSDRPRICQFSSEQEAREMAEAVGRLVEKDL